MRYDAVAFLESLYRAGQPTLPESTLPALRDDWHYLWDERAAIMEYDGGLPREEAERLALVEIVKLMEAARSQESGSRSDAE